MTQERGEGWWERALAERRLRCAVVALAAFLLVLFLYAALRRVMYPYEVEWIESGMLVSVLRIVHGQGVYVAPSLNYVPYLYAPLYLYLAAGMTKLVGIGNHGYAGLRLLSALSTLGSAAAVYALVATETRRRIAALAAAGVFVGCYAIADSFYDIGRVDALFVCLLLCALLAQRRGHPVVAAVLWVLVFQTKQTVLPLAIVVLAAEWRRPRQMAAALGTYAALAGVSVWVGNHATAGWYGFYLFHVAQGLPMVWRQAALYWPSLVIGPLAVAWTAILAALLVTRPNLRGEAANFYGFASVALLGGVWFVAAHRGASTNALMPVYAWTAVLFGAALGRLLAWAEERGSSMTARLALLAAVVQMVALIYNPGRFVPPASARAATEQFIATLRALPGDVYVINHSYDAMLAGKQPHAEGEALGAVLDSPPEMRTQGVRAEIAQALAERRYSAVVADNVQGGAFLGFDRAYPLGISTGLGGFWYITSQPQWYLLPCEAKEQEMRLVGPGTLVLAGGCGAR